MNTNTVLEVGKEDGDCTRTQLIVWIDTYNGYKGGKKGIN